MANKIQNGGHILAKKGDNYVVTRLFDRSWAEKDFVLRRNEVLMTARAVVGALNHSLRGNGSQERFPIVGDAIPASVVDLPQYRFAVLKSGEAYGQKFAAQKARRKTASAAVALLKAAGISL